MILVRYVPWKLMALPTPICVLAVTVLPAPFIIVAEGIKRLLAKIRRASCKSILHKQERQAIILYTKRADSQELLEQEVFPSLGITTVILENLQANDKQYRSFAAYIPKTLGYTFPILIYLKQGKIHVESLHDCVYEKDLRIRNAEEVVKACLEKIGQEQ